jgi:hypothetical protein
MSLIKASVPRHIRQAYTSGLGDFVDSGSPLWSLLLNKYAAIPTYNLVLSCYCKLIFTSDVSSLPTLPDSVLQPTGWRFLAAEGDLYGACHVGSVTSSLPPKLTGFSSSAPVLTAIECLNQLPSIGLTPILPPGTLPPGDYEIRILRIPWLRFEAFWLHWLAPDGKRSPCDDWSANSPANGGQEPGGGGSANNQHRGTDLVVPYIGFPESASGGQLSAMQALLLPDFLNAISKRAQDICHQFLDHQARIQEAQARQARAQAEAQESSVATLKAQASALEAQAKKTRAQADQAAGSRGRRDRESNNPAEATKPGRPS